MKKLSLICFLSITAFSIAFSQTKINPAKLLQGQSGGGSLFLKTDNSGNVSFSNNLNGGVISGAGNAVLGGDLVPLSQADSRYLVSEYNHSIRNFTYGTLIQTSIDYSGFAGDPWVLEIKGNSYGNIIPLNVHVQGYIYNNQANYLSGGIANGLSISGLVLFNYNGKLCFWYPPQGYWQGYNIIVYIAYPNQNINKITSISDEVKPPSVTREYELSSLIRQSIHSGNYTSQINLAAFSTGTLADDRLSPNVALKNIDNSFLANQTMPNATADGHALNRQSGDSRYLGISATAVNATQLNSQAASYYLDYNNLNNKPVALSQFANDLNLGALYQPLENQRLRTTDNVTFSSIHSSINNIDIGGSLTLENSAKTNGGSRFWRFLNMGGGYGDKLGIYSYAADGSYIINNLNLYNYGGDVNGTWGVAAATAANHAVNKSQLDALSTQYLGINANAYSASYLAVAKNINGTPFNGGFDINTTEYLHSQRDFINGTLIQTSIDYSGYSGDPWILEIKGNSYFKEIPIDIQVQGYIYYNSITAVAGIANGTSITGLVAINVGGNLCFWFPSQAYWQGYNVNVYTAYSGRATNKVTSITDVAKPASTKEVSIPIAQSLHTSNYTTTLDARYLQLGATATNSGALNGQNGFYYRNASNINTGTLADAQLSANVALLSADNAFSGRMAIGGAIDNAYRVNVVGNMKVSTSFDVGTSITASLLNLTGLAQSTTNTQVLSINSSVVKSQEVKDLEVATYQPVTVSPFTSDVGGGVIRHSLTLDCGGYYKKTFKVYMTNNTIVDGTQVTFTNMKPGGDYTVIYYSNPNRPVTYDSSGVQESGSGAIPTFTAPGGTFIHRFASNGTVAIKAF